MRNDNSTSPHLQRMSCIQYVRRRTGFTQVYAYEKYIPFAASEETERICRLVSLIASTSLKLKPYRIQQFERDAKHALELDMAVGQVRGIIQLKEHSDAVPLSGCKCKTASRYTNPKIWIADNITVGAEVI